MNQNTYLQPYGTYQPTQPMMYQFTPVLSTPSSMIVVDPHLYNLQTQQQYEQINQMQSCIATLNEQLQQAYQALQYQDQQLQHLQIQTQQDLQNRQMEHQQELQSVCNTNRQQLETQQQSHLSELNHIRLNNENQLHQSQCTKQSYEEQLKLQEIQLNQIKQEMCDKDQQIESLQLHLNLLREQSYDQLQYQEIQLQSLQQQQISTQDQYIESLIQEKNTWEERNLAIKQQFVDLTASYQDKVAVLHHEHQYAQSESQVGIRAQAEENLTLKRTIADCKKQLLAVQECVQRKDRELKRLEQEWKLTQIVVERNKEILELEKSNFRISYDALQDKCQTQDVQLLRLQEIQNTLLPEEDGKEAVEVTEDFRLLLSNGVKRDLAELITAHYDMVEEGIRLRGILKAKQEDVLHWRQTTYSLMTKYGVEKSEVRKVMKFHVPELDTERLQQQVGWHQHDARVFQWVVQKQRRMLRFLCDHLQFMMKDTTSNTTVQLIRTMDAQIETETKAKTLEIKARYPTPDDLRVLTTLDHLNFYRQQEANKLKLQSEYHQQLTT